MRFTKLTAGIAMAACLLSGQATGADRPASAAELEKLEEQVRELDKDLSVLKATTDKQLDAQDKRIQDIGLATAQQANHLAAIANETASVGNYIGWTSIAITVIVFMASLITYFSAKRRAQDEAKAASAEWFKENARQLQEEIAGLKNQVEEAMNSIAEDRKKVANAAQDTIDHSKASKERIDRAAERILQPKLEAETPVDVESVCEAKSIVQFVSEGLRSKPEVDFSPEEHYARGLARYADDDYRTALASFESALAGLSNDATPIDTVRYLFAKALTLGRLGQSKEAIDVYDDLDQRFGTDPSPAVRERVVKGLFNKAVTLGELGQSKEAIDIYDDLDQRFGTDPSPAVRERVVKGLVNKGATLGKLDQPNQAFAVYDDLDQRFGADPTPAVREQLALARNNLGFSQLLLAKTHWTEEKQRRELLSAARQAFERSLTQCTEDDRAMRLGNLGYVLHLTGAHETARAYTLESLSLGGQKTLDGQRDDAQQHRVEPEDSQYEQLLDELWGTLNDAPTDGD
ncbi:MAG: tetratricopeptide repeat protein [Methylococcus sp.]